MNIDDFTSPKLCDLKCGKFSCKLEFGHSPGWHSDKCGVLWEDSNKIPIKKVEHFIIEGKISKDCHLLIEYTAKDGRKFTKRDYQIFENVPE